jgi:hypothetical protein
MFQMFDIWLRRRATNDLPHDAGYREPIDEPGHSPPAGDPPGSDRPPDKDPIEPEEIPLRDPATRRTR